MKEPIGRIAPKGTCGGFLQRAHFTSKSHCPKDKVFISNALYQKMLEYLGIVMDGAKVETNNILLYLEKMKFLRRVV